jgi:phosphatase NudJ
MARPHIPSWYFALVVVRLGRRFLVVQENKNGRWYLPAGRVDPGETLEAAARRETHEESGLSVVLEGILRIEHTPANDGSARVRVIFVARPEDDHAPKKTADKESLGAAWMTLEDIRKLPLRNDEVLDILRSVLQGAPVYPLSLLAPEGAPFAK